MYDIDLKIKELSHKIDVDYKYEIDINSKFPTSEQISKALEKYTEHISPDLLIYLNFDLKFEDKFNTSIYLHSKNGLSEYIRICISYRKLAFTYKNYKGQFELYPYKRWKQTDIEYTSEEMLLYIIDKEVFLEA